MKSQKMIRFFAVLFGVLLLLNIVGVLTKSKKEPVVQDQSLSHFIQDVKGGKVQAATIVESARNPLQIQVTNKDNTQYSFFALHDSGMRIVDTLTENKVKYMTKPEEPPSFLETFFFSWGPTIFFLVAWIFLMKKMSSGGSGSGGIFGFGKSKAKLIDPEEISVSFADVVGCDEAKIEIQEFTEFLKNPEKFAKLGGKTPRGVLLTGPAGTGKAQPLYANIRVPNGWEKMGNLKVGDLVCNPDGGYSKISGIFPQGIKNNYKITFSDGSIAESCDEHLWTVKFSDLHKDYRTYSLKEINEKLEKGYKARVYPISQVDSPEIDLPFDPYLLGLLLGDGAIATSHNMISISSADEEIISSIENLIGEDYQLSRSSKYDYTIIMKNKPSKYLCRLGVFQNKFTQTLWDMGLCGKQSHEKFVPQIYFHSSYEQRLALLQGLMDTDGTIEPSNFTYYSTTSKELAEDVVELARSLGMISYINSEKLKNYSYKGSKHIANHVSYNVTIKSYQPSILFRLERKKAMAKTREYIPTKSIEKIEYFGQTEMQCIMLDSENHLYITDGYNTTHNTMLAKALAKESGVPFFTLSGSDFVEMFVGVGASRVRDMFETAKKVAPCVLFIDEIDAIGGKRSSGGGMGGGHDEREQTLNQLLVELDGMDSNKGIILVGATNRPEILDKALLRPGRIDRQIVVSLPDVFGRQEILKIHSKNVPLATGVELNKIARGTPGFSGAELANLINESALFAARRGKKFVEQIDLEDAKDKIMMGVERPSLSMTEKAKRETAYHESGHAVVARLLPQTDPVYKVTIIPRGRALGVTMQLPEQDRWSHDKEFLTNKIAILMGGRAAEEVFCKTLTNGASNDIAVATDIATNMVTQWGMSDLGPVALGARSQNFLGQSGLDTSGLSQQTLHEVNIVVRDLINNQYLRARKILEDNNDIVEAMTQALMEVETIDDWQIENLIQRRQYNDPAGLETMRELSEKRDLAIEEQRKQLKNFENKNKGLGKSDVLPT